MGVLLFPAWTKARVWREELHPRDWRGRFIRKLGAASPATGRAPSRATTRRQSSGPRLTRAQRARIEAARAVLPASRADWMSARGHYFPAQKESERRVAKVRAQMEDTRRRIAQREQELTEQLREYGLSADEIDMRVANDYVLTRERRELANLEAALRRVEREARTRNPDLDPDMPEELWPRYEEDANGVQMPPEAYHRYLDAVLDAGAALDEALQAAYRADPEIQRLEALLTPEDLAPVTGPIVVTEEGVRGLPKRTPARAQLAQRRQQILFALLSQLREMGGVSHTYVTEWYGRSPVPLRSDWRERLKAAEKFFPSDWLRLSAQDELYVTGDARGSYYPDRKLLGVLPTEADQVPSDGFGDYALETMVHELAHRMEQMVPGLKELEFSYLRRRATGPDGNLELARDRQDLPGGSHYARGEWVYPDDWIDPYVGKTYEDIEDGLPEPDDPASLHWEVFSAGIEELFRVVPEYDAGPGLRQFTLGILATLARGQ